LKVFELFLNLKLNFLGKRGETRRERGGKRRRRRGRERRKRGGERRRRRGRGVIQ